MPDIDEKALLKMTPNKRWAARMNQAWHEAKAERPEDARFYTDHSPMIETPDPDRPGFVKREPYYGHGRIQIWRPGRPTKVAKGMVQETYNGEDWYGFAEFVKKSTNYGECVAQVKALLAKFEGVELVKAAPKKAKK